MRPLRQRRAAWAAPGSGRAQGKRARDKEAPPVTPLSGPGQGLRLRLGGHTDGLSGSFGTTLVLASLAGVFDWCAYRCYVHLRRDEASGAKSPFGVIVIVVILICALFMAVSIWLKMKEMPR